MEKGTLRNIVLGSALVGTAIAFPLGFEWGRHRERDDILYDLRRIRSDAQFLDVAYRQTPFIQASRESKEIAYDLTTAIELISDNWDSAQINVSKQVTEKYKGTQ